MYVAFYVYAVVGTKHTEITCWIHSEQLHRNTSLMWSVEEDYLAISAPYSGIEKKSLQRHSHNYTPQ